MKWMRLCALALLALTLASCSYWRASGVHNSQVNQNSGVVQLFKKNFKVIGRMTGEASATYVFGVFGPDKQNLYSQAMIDLERKAKLEGNARALMSIVTDQKVTWSWFATTVTVYVSANVIEFTE